MARSKTITGVSGQREAAIQRRMMATIERKYERAYRREIKRAIRQIANAQTGQQRNTFEDMHRSSMMRILNANWNQCANEFGARVLQPDVKSIWRAVERKDFMLEPATQYRILMEGWAAKYGAQKLTEITGTTLNNAKEIVAKAVADAIAEGLNESQTGALIQSYIETESTSISMFRSRMIARTETHGASQVASFYAAYASGIDVKKEWASAISDRTREAHLAANGQVREMNEFYDVGGEPMMYPGDPDGSAGNVINCRCINLIMPK